MGRPGDTYNDPSTAMAVYRLAERQSVLGQDAVVPWPVPVAQVASAGGADFAHIAGSNGAGSDGGSTTPLSASSGPHTASSFMAPPARSRDGAGPFGLTPAPTGTFEPIGPSRPPRPSRTLGGSSSRSSGASADVWPCC